MRAKHTRYPVMKKLYMLSMALLQVIHPREGNTSSTITSGRGMGSTDMYLNTAKDIHVR